MTNEGTWTSTEMEEAWIKTLTKAVVQGTTQMMLEEAMERHMEEKENKSTNNKLWQLMKKEKMKLATEGREVALMRQETIGLSKES